MRLLLLFLEFLFILFLEPFLLLREPPTVVSVSELPPLPPLPAGSATGASGASGTSGASGASAMPRTKRRQSGQVSPP